MHLQPLAPLLSLISRSFESLLPGLLPGLGSFHTFQFIIIIITIIIIIIIIDISIITVFAGVLFVHQPGVNHALRASVTQVNHSVHTLSTFLRIRADPSMQILLLLLLLLLFLLLLLLLLLLKHPID